MEPIDDLLIRGHEYVVSRRGEQKELLKNAVADLPPSKTPLISRHHQLNVLKHCCWVSLAPLARQVISPRPKKFVAGLGLGLVGPPLVNVRLCLVFLAL